MYNVERECLVSVNSNIPQPYRRVMQKFVYSGNDVLGPGTVTMIISSMSSKHVVSPLHFEFVPEDGKRKIAFAVHKGCIRELAADLVRAT